jgi:DNA-binding transcriptional regulator GbsR (MarR family)
MAKHQSAKSDRTDELSPVAQRFVLHWGEMGTRWGINRTVAQIHALLYISEKPLTADDFVRILAVSRSNVGNSIKELQGWKLATVVNQFGQRKEYYETSKDVWELFKIVLEGRMQREIQPTRDVLRQCVSELEQAGKEDQYVKKQLTNLAEFVETSTAWVQEVLPMSTPMLKRIVRMGSKIQKLFG